MRKKRRRIIEPERGCPKNIRVFFRTVYGYDASGNNLTILTADAGVTTGTITMTYDALNRMVAWTDGTKTESHTYRGNEWHRASTTTNNGTTTSTTTYLYDGDNVLIDYVSGASSSTMTFNKLYVTPFLDQNLSMTDASNNTYYYSQDGLGSVRTLTNSSGTKVNHYDYTAFGRTIRTTGATNETKVVIPNLPTPTTEAVTQRYTYTGREVSAFDLAPMYYRYRHYFSGVGRWGARDPIGYDGGIGLYVFGDDMVGLMVDPFGLLSISYETEPKTNKPGYEFLLLFTDSTKTLQVKQTVQLTIKIYFCDGTSAMAQKRYIEAFDFEKRNGSGKDSHDFDASSMITQYASKDYQRNCPKSITVTGTGVGKEQKITFRDPDESGNWDGGGVIREDSRAGARLQLAEPLPPQKGNQNTDKPYGGFDSTPSNKNAKELYSFSIDYSASWDCSKIPSAFNTDSIEVKWSSKDKDVTVP